MSININNEVNNKRKDFIANFKNFYKQYVNSSSSIENLDNCACLARRAAESYCRYVILDSNKTDEEKKDLLYKTEKERHTLGALKDNILKKEDAVVRFNEEEKKHLRTELELVLHKGNHGCHDNDKGSATTLRDLEKIKPIILDLADYILDSEYTDLLIEKMDGEIKEEAQNKIAKNETIINQTSSGSGDNIGRDKIVDRAI
jgi:hypothetical protein